MNFVPNKQFYQRVGRIDSNLLQNGKKKLINKNNLANGIVFHNENKNKKNVDKEEGKGTSFCSLMEQTVDNKTRQLERQQFLENNSAFIINNNNNNTTNLNSYVVTVITEGRGYAQGELGIASINIHSPVLFISQFSDDFCYKDLIMKLNLLQPNEIIFPNTQNNKSNFVNIIKENFSKIKIIPLPRRHFNIDDGLNMINDLSSIECKSLIKFIEKRYYTIAAISALLKYLKQILSINFLQGGLKIEYQAKCGRMLIDHDTCHRLELLYPTSTSQTKEKKNSLYGIFDHTVTAIGKRQLRARILEPYFDVCKILQIQDCVQELIENPELLLSLQEKLEKFWNVDKILNLIIVEKDDDKVKSVELMFDKLLLLKTILDYIPDLATHLRLYKHSMFNQIYNSLTDESFSVMLTTINDIIRPEAQFCRGITQYFTRIHAIQEGVNEMLDFARETYTKLIDAIRDNIKELALKHEIPLRMMYMISKGFYIQLTIAKNNQGFAVPSDMNMFSRKGNILYLTNPEIIKLNVRVTEVINEIYELSDKILRQLIVNIIQYIDVNHKLVETIANLDIIQSYTKVSLNDGYSRPKFGDETKVIDAVHPLLQHSKTKAPIVRNNIIATPEYNMFIITGPNMSGKTIYIKMIAILQVMAQLGCYVPATRATFRLCDRIFTRIGYEDGSEQYSSSYEIEIREIEYTFKNVTPNSLIIIDELCRSTNPSDGKETVKRICEKFSILQGQKIYNVNESDENEENHIVKNFKIDKIEKIVNITSPFIYITTHFMCLTQLADEYLNVTNLHVSADEKYVNGVLQLQYTHKVKEGVTSVKRYGILLAQTVNLPETVIKLADEILNDYEVTSSKKANENGSINKSYFLDKIFLNLNETLNQTSREFLIESNFNNTSLIANFMENNDNKDVLITTVSENHLNSLSISTNQLLKDFQNQLYDTYAGLADIFRNKLLSLESDGFTINNYQKITNLFENLISTLPKPLLSEILKNNCLQNLKETSLSYEINSNSKPNNSTMTSCNNKNQSNNTKWSKLYSDISCHSFIKKIAKNDMIPSLSQLQTTAITMINSASLASNSVQCEIVKNSSLTTEKLQDNEKILVSKKNNGETDTIHNNILNEINSETTKINDPNNENDNLMVFDEDSKVKEDDNQHMQLRNNKKLTKISGKGMKNRCRKTFF